MKYNLQTSYYGEDREENTSRKVFIWLAGIFSAIFIFFFVVDLAMLQKYRFILISGSSMQNTLNSDPVYGGGQDGVYILLTKDVTYGDIIVREKYDGTSIIKRVMALEGDKICIARVEIGEGDDKKDQIRFMRIKAGSNKVEVLEETYIKNYGVVDPNTGKDGYEAWDEFETRSAPTIGEVVYASDFYRKHIEGKEDEATLITYQDKEYMFVNIPEGKFFYMGDNRTNSDDCRKEGAQSADEIIGKVVRISHNVYSFKNSPFYLFNYAGGYLGLIWDEIVSYFSF